MSYQFITKESYELTAEEFAQNVAPLAPRASIERFSQLLPKKAKIVDIGCGSGRDAKIFDELGVQVLGIDFCSNLLEIAKKQAPHGQFQLMDVENIAFEQNSFEGAWAGCILSHIPKAKIPAVLKKIHFILKNEGYFYVTVKKGEGELIEKDTRYESQVEKFWSFFEEEEFKNFLEKAGFKILELCTVDKQFSYQTNPAIRAFCQKQT